MKMVMTIAAALVVGGVAHSVVVITAGSALILGGICYSAYTLGKHWNDQEKIYDKQTIIYYQADGYLRVLPEATAEREPGAAATAPTDADPRRAPPLYASSFV